VYLSLPEIKFVPAAAADAHDAVYLNCSDKQQQQPPFTATYGQ